MATRYLTALDYADWHTSAVLRKHAKRRPLGELETRYQYTPAQPVLSCRTVDIDVCGTRTYRPRTSADILVEQQTLIHKLVQSRRTTTSAPAGHSQKGFGQLNESQSRAENKIHVQGRPYTSASQLLHTPAGRQKSASSSTQTKAKDRLKNVKSATDSFMVISVDRDLLETKRSYDQLTNQIHAHWRPENSNLNQGHFIRGQKRPEDVPPSLDAWLTFGGSAGEDSGGGVIDAFANLQTADDYYNIEGSVGSRVAQQLQRGDRIRIGINGRILSHDLRMKKGAGSEEPPVENAQTEEHQEEKEKLDTTPRSASDKDVSPPTTNDDMFGDMVFESIEDIIDEAERAKESKENTDSSKPPRSKPVVDFPLSWADQMSRPQVKVISPRPTITECNQENLCETCPVLFNEVMKYSYTRPKLATTGTITADGYRLKQRVLGSSASAGNRLGSAGNKVKAISFDHNSPEEEQRLGSLSVDDVIQMSLEKHATRRTADDDIISPKPKSETDSGFRLDDEPADSAMILKKLPEQKLKDKMDIFHSSSARSLGISYREPSQAMLDSVLRKTSSSSGRQQTTSRPSSTVPLLGAMDKNLGVVTQRVGSRGRKLDRRGSEKGGRSSLSLAKAISQSRGQSSSINTGSILGETEFIQIAQPIKKPNAPYISPTSGVYNPFPVNILQSEPQDYPPRSNTPEDGLKNSVDSFRTVPLTNSARPGPVSARPNASQNLPEEQAAFAELTPSQNVNKNTSGCLEDSPTLPVTDRPTVPPAYLHLPTVIKAISIPTGFYPEDEDNEEVTVVQRRERTMRDQQIDQITSLLGEAILSGNRK